MQLRRGEPLIIELDYHVITMLNIRVKALTLMHT